MKSLKNRRSKKYASARNGSLLLDLFIASAILASSLLLLGEFGSKSLKLAQRNRVERIEMLAAESILTKEIDSHSTLEERTWNESFQGIPTEIRLIVDYLKSEKLKRYTVHVSSGQGPLSNRVSVSLSRVVLWEPEL